MALAVLEKATPASAHGATVVLDVRVVCGAGGGPDKTILNQPRFLAPAGYRNLCAYLHPPDDPGFEQIRRKADTWGAPLFAVPDRGPWDWRIVGELLRLCRRERVAIWHGHDYKSNLLGLLLRRFHSMRLVTTVHGWGVKETRRTAVYNRIDRLCLPHYERVLCVSHDLHEECVRCGVPKDRCLLIENAIDISEFRRRRDPEEVKHILGIAPNRFLVGAVGRLSAEKGFDVLIRAVNRLLQDGLDVGLILVGEGDERSRLQSLSRELGCDDRVHFLGYRADPRDCYEAMDVYALSSFREGLPNVVLEAMAMEVPVVATRIAGVPRLIAEERSGLLVEPGNGQALATALARVLKEQGLREQLRSEGRATVLARYSFESRMQKVRQLYDDLLGHQR